MRNTIKKIYAVLGLLFILTPVFAFAQAQGTFFGITYQCAPKTVNGTTVYGECNFDDLVAATMHVVNWGTAFALSFSVFVIAYAGYGYMISGDNPGERKKANGRLEKVVIGIVIILLAWVIVHLIATALQVNTGVSNLI